MVLDLDLKHKISIRHSEIAKGNGASFTDFEPMDKLTPSHEK